MQEAFYTLVILGPIVGFGVGALLMVGFTAYRIWKA